MNEKIIEPILFTKIFIINHSIKDLYDNKSRFI